MSIASRLCSLPPVSASPSCRKVANSLASEAQWSELCEILQKCGYQVGTPSSFVLLRSGWVCGWSRFGGSSVSGFVNLLGWACKAKQLETDEILPLARWMCLTCSPWRLMASTYRWGRSEQQREHTCKTRHIDRDRIWRSKFLSQTETMLLSMKLEMLYRYFSFNFFQKMLVRS